MTRSSYFLLVAIALLTFCTGDSLAQWRQKQVSAEVVVRCSTYFQRPLQMNYDLTVKEATQIAQLTDMTRFKELLRPILVPRIVNTPQHRQVGDVIQSFCNPC